MASFVLVQQPALTSIDALDHFIKPHASFYQWYDIASHGQKLLVWSLERPETACYYKQDGVGFIAVAGTLLYKGMDGKAAASQFLHDFDPSNLGALRPYGQHALCIEKQGRLMVLNDALGAWKIYHHSDGRVVSAGFLETLLLEEKPKFCQQGLYEYVFNGHALGENTFLQSVKAILPGYGCELDLEGPIKTIHCSEMPVSDSGAISENSIEEEAAAQLDRLQAVFAAYRKAEGGVSASLSGGYDSRLMLALFLAQNMTPDLFVYGTPSEPDVVSAQQIAQKAEIPIRHINKKRIEAEKTSVDRLLLYFDGWPEDGFQGAQVDLHDRLQRSKTALYMANGSGGEIYRHFFLYPNKPVKTASFLQATYGRADPGIVTSVFNQKQYGRAVAKSFSALMGGDDKSLLRNAIDRVYMNVRITHEKARDIVINHRFHKVLYPFMEHSIVRGTSGIAFHHRQFGVLEAKMNALQNPKLASIDGEYGFNFLDGANAAYKRRILFSYLRPVWVRRLIPALKRLARKPQGVAALTADMANIVPGTDFAHMRHYFMPDKVSDPLVASRIATLEILADRFGIEAG